MTREPLWRRYDRFFGRNRRADTKDELTFHYEMRVRDYMRRGMSEEAARGAANERLGGITEVEDACAAQDAAFAKRDRRREWIGEFRQDVKYGIRVLRRAPGFAAVSVLTLALGIAASTAMFTVMNRVLLAPLPFPDADRLVSIYERAPNGRNDENPVSAGNYTDWVARTRSFDAIGAYGTPSGAALTGDGDPQQVTAVGVTTSLFAVYGIRPLLGRVFVADDSDGGAVVVISEGLWRRNFGADANIVGRTITLSNNSYTVVGVAPANGASTVDVWRPMTTAGMDITQRKSHNFSVIARMRAGVTLKQARAEMSGLARAIAVEHPEFMKGWDVSVEALHDDIVEDARPLLVILGCAVGVLLLIACGNIANLLLARAVAREREMVLRGALGAARGRLVRQLLTESFIIAAIGGTLGVAGAAASLGVLLRLAPPLPLADDASIDGVVILFALGVTGVCTLLFGLAPAIRLANADLQGTLRAASGSSGASGHGRIRGILLSAQIALSVVLLVSAGLLVRSFRELNSIDLGIRTEGVSALTIDLPRSRYQDIPQQVAFHEALLARVARIPGVLSVAGTTVTPTATPSTWSFAIEGRLSTNPSGREDPQPIHFITSDYQRVLSIPLRAGRAFDARDRAGSPVVVMVNDALARLHWPGESPIGKRISLAGQQGPWMEIVGVTADTRMAAPDQPAVPALYMHYAQKPYAWLTWMTLIVRTANGVDPVTLMPSLRAAVWEGDKLLPVQRFNRLDDLYADTIAPRRFAMALIAGFGFLALVLCIIGLYGLISYNVAQQRREIGVRLALGATQREIVRSVLGASARLAVIGAACGLVAAFASTRLLAGFLYGVSPVDATTFALTAMIVVTIGIAAAIVPAVRAARTPLLSALRG